MDVNSPLSARANAFSIAALMSGDPTLDATLLGYGYGPFLASTSQRPSSDCYYDWGQGSSFMSGLKGMEGRPCVIHAFSNTFRSRQIPWQRQEKSRPKIRREPGKIAQQKPRAVLTKTSHYRCVLSLKRCCLIAIGYTAYLAMPMTSCWWPVVDSVLVVTGNLPGRRHSMSR